MVLINRPYVSDFLVKTVKEKNFPIISTPAAREMVQDEELNWISEEEAIQKLQDRNSRIYSNSENNINWIQQNAGSLELPGQIEIFKNKAKFRELIKESYPDYLFKAVKHSDLRTLDVTSLRFPFIIKPSVGFSSIAVYKIDNPEDWEQALIKIDAELKNWKEQYPREVINITEFILEDYIKGEEYAVDCYFDKEGNPVILNILHHIFSSDKDVSDRVYSSSRKIIEAHHAKIQRFLEMVGEKAGLSNFPLHLEMRIDERGKIIPIEGNPFRFGGFCTTGDLSWYAYGINSYEYYFHSLKPDWEEVFKTRSEKQYNLIVLDNNSGIPEDQIAYFDYDALLENFEKPLDLRRLPLSNYAIFGFLFTETTIGEDAELKKILHSNLQEYITLKRDTVDSL